jgi:predicted nucleotidyltransferase component of viral defense system
MAIIPLEKKLQKKLHRQIAFAQDILVNEVYRFFPKAVLHGGTSIWRCFGSNRFSEDLDFYLPSCPKKIQNKFLEDLENLGFSKLKFKQTKNAIFSKFEYAGVIVRFEALIKKIKVYKTKRFQMIDGSSIIVNVLPTATLLQEKIDTYLSRKKVRDLYDIFFLLSFVERNAENQKTLREFLSKYSFPKDEKDIKSLIIAGAIPRIEDMLQEIKKWGQ